MLEFEDARGERQTLRTTDEHPFWVVNTSEAGGRYIPAQHLEVGQSFTGPNGERLTLIASRRDSHPTGIPVYNFEVDGFHTYFVGDRTASTPILTHNNQDCLPGANRPDETPIRKKPLGEFKPSQQTRLKGVTDDIAAVRQGHMPSGPWGGRNHGRPFDNREGDLPRSKRGYTEYYVPGKDGRPSGARIVVNEDTGQVYYSQHYNDDGSGFSLIDDIRLPLLGVK